MNDDNSGTDGETKVPAVSPSPDISTSVPADEQQMVVSHATSPWFLRKKILVGLGLLLVLGAGGSWWLLKGDSPKQPAPIAAKAAVAPEVDFAPEHALFVMLGSKISAYDTASKKIAVITSSVPTGSTVLDFYYGSSKDWRYYAYLEGQNDLYYADQSSEPKLVKTLESAYVVAANAKNQVYAYSEALDPNTSPTKTYVSQKGDKPSLVYESSRAYDKAGIKNPKYMVRDISADGRKLLFQQAQCINCGGGLTGNMFTLDVGTKTPQVINTADQTSSLIAYFTDSDDVIFTTGEFNKSYEDISNPRMTTYRIAKGVKTQLYDRKGGDLYTYDTSRNGDYILPALRVGKDETKISSVIELRDGQAKEKLASLGKGIESPYAYAVGDSKDDCLSVAFYVSRSFTKTNAIQNYSAGVLCKNPGGTYAYTEVDKARYSIGLAENRTFEFQWQAL
jgi:hypothetical protein